MVVMGLGTSHKFRLKTSIGFKFLLFRVCSLISGIADNIEQSKNLPRYPLFVQFALVGSPEVHTLGSTLRICILIHGNIGAAAVSLAMAVEPERGARSVVVAVDGSEASKMAVRWAATHVLRQEDDLHLVKASVIMMYTHSTHL